MSDFDNDDSGLFSACAGGLASAERVLSHGTEALLERVGFAPGTRVVLPVEAQHAAHSLAWSATVLEGLRQTYNWASRLRETGRLGDVERSLLLVAFGEYLAQFAGGIPMNQGEIARLSAFDLGEGTARLAADASVASLVEAAGCGASHLRLTKFLADEVGDTLGDDGLEEELRLVRSQFHRFSRERVVPYAHGWHLRDELIPDEILVELAGLGVFGLTIPEAHGGSGMGKIAMCVVSEELARGYLGVGSLGTRSEIAAELVLAGGTKEQQARWLPGIASGKVLPTAVFTEPDTGSDLGALQTRAERSGRGWRINGSKTWITHAARADLMTLLARTDPTTSDHRGLSMFLAPKRRGNEIGAFPDCGIDGSEIGVLGYRGMREFALSFDGFEVGSDGLLGGKEGRGFRQLMETFESARIQTAARSIGVAQSALDLGCAYARERKQFGKLLIAFPRVYRKLAMMAVEIAVARQMTYHAARVKDSGKRCDLEAGMAKLLGARIAWAAADNALQIHGGNGFALEFPISRVLCDARILSIFEGASEIQATIIARRLLERRN